MTKEASMGKTRRAIVRSDEAEVRGRVARALGDSANFKLHWHQDRLVKIEAYDWSNIKTEEKMGRESIFPGRDGWEIEVRRKLPAPWAWWPQPREPGCEFLARRNDNDVGIAFARADGVDLYKKETDADGDYEHIPAASLTDARERAEDECWTRGLFGVVEEAPPADEEPAFPTDAGVEPPHSRAVEGVRLGVDRPAPGASPSAPARALRKAIASVCDPESDQAVTDAQGRAIDRLCEAFVADLRASLPAPPMPLPRTTDGALTAYLLEHYRDAWRPGDDALALAIRLLGELTGERDAFAAEARASAALAVTREQERDATRRLLEAARAARAVDAATIAEWEKVGANWERVAAGLKEERDEARADLATLRQGVAALAAKMGAPHG